MQTKTHLDKKIQTNWTGANIPSGKKNNGKRLSSAHPYLREGFQFKCCDHKREGL